MNAARMAGQSTKNSYFPNWLRFIVKGIGALRWSLYETAGQGIALGISKGYRWCGEYWTLGPAKEGQEC